MAGKAARVVVSESGAERVSTPGLDLPEICVYSWLPEQESNSKFSCFETLSLPSLHRRDPCGFAFYVTQPIRFHSLAITFRLS